MSTTTNTPPSIWAGCLTCRNSLDELVGEWFDIREAASVDAVAVHQHRPGGLCCPDPELWVFDLDGVPVGREMDLGEAVAWGEVYTELEPHLWDALGAWVASARRSAGAVHRSSEMRRRSSLSHVDACS